MPKADIIEISFNKQNTKQNQKLESKQLQMCITIIGSLNYDIVTTVKKVPQAGETIMATSFDTHIGGKGLNQTVAIAKLCKALPVRIIGHVGNDSFGKEILEALGSYNVNTNYVKVLPGEANERTGTATIIVEEGGQNRIMVTPGANQFTKYTPTELSQLFSITEDIEYVVLQNEIPDPFNIIRWLHEMKPEYPIIYNPSPFNACEVPNEIWNFIDILIVNEIEALQIIEKVLPHRYAEVNQKIKVDWQHGYTTIAFLLVQEVINKDSKGTVILTLGSRGCIYAGPGTPISYTPAVKVGRVVDTTGAGDTFLGGVVSQLVQGVSLQEAVSFATVASSLAIQKEGASSSTPAFEDVIYEQSKLR